MTDDLDSVLGPWRAAAGRSVLLFDFDGTLSPLVDDPAAARPAPGVVEALDALAGAYLRVGVMSGRPVSFLAAHLPGSVVLSGLYGLERAVDGAVVAHPEADRWRPVVAEVTARAEAATEPGGPADGVRVEAKGLSITLHVRTRPDLLDAARDLADRLAAGSGLVVRGAKMSFELHPPIRADKGSALVELAQGADRVLFAGDDVGDLPAYEALASLDRTVATLAVAVDGAELPDEVRAEAQLLLPGQSSILGFLQALHP